MSTYHVVSIFVIFEGDLLIGTLSCTTGTLSDYVYLPWEILRVIVRYCNKISTFFLPRENIRTRCLSTTWDCYCYRSALRKDNTIQHTMQCQRELKYFLDVFVLIVRSISYVILPYYGNVPVVQLKVPIVKKPGRKGTFWSFYWPLKI